MTMYMDDRTQAELDKLEGRLKKVYRQAYKELDAKTQKFFSDFEERYANEFAAYKNGAYTDSQWKAWLQSQIKRSDRWIALRSTMANRYTEANTVASSYINDKGADIYAESANYAGYQIYQKMGINFSIVREQTIKNLIEEKDNLISFRTTRINPVRDYKWNSKQIQSALTQGILQGESVNKIADRFLQVMKNNRNAAIRNARTALTSAQNAGVQDRIDEASDIGIEIQKEWIAARDSRTRDTHMSLDGYRVGAREKFPNGLMYPGDSAGRPEEVYNCRCAMRMVIDGINDQQGDKKGYEKWIENKKGDKIRLSSSKSNETSLRYVYEGRAGLNKNRKQLLSKVKSSGEYVRLPVGSISNKDLAYLSAYTKDEFALWRSKTDEILCHGTAKHCGLPNDIYDELLSGKYEIVAHTHVDRGPLVPSQDDMDTLQAINQHKSVIVGLDGVEKEFFSNIFDY